MAEDELAAVVQRTMSTVYLELKKFCEVRERELEALLVELGHAQAVQDLRANAERRLDMRKDAGEQKEEVQEKMEDEFVIQQDEACVDGEPARRVINFLSGSEGSTVTLPLDESDLSKTTSTAQAVHSSMRSSGSKTPRRGRNLGTRTFTLLPDWSEAQEEESSDEDAMTQMQYYRGLDIFLDKAKSAHHAHLHHVEMVKASKLVILPTSKPRILWDMLASVLLLYDLVLIPMQVFDLPNDGFFFAMSVVVMLYWTLDICANFFVGYSKPDGEIELRIKHVAYHYCVTWLFPDALIVTMDWLTYGPALFSGSSSNDSALASFGLVRVMKLARFVRLLRMLRVIRLGKLQTCFQQLQGLIGLESTAIMLNILKNIMLIGFINHSIACIWFSIGKADKEHGWLSTVERANSGWLSDYCLSMYWSVANFTPGSSGILLRTTAELAFTVFCLFFALVVSSIFVSSTTSMISRLMGIQSVQQHHVWVLKGFLFQHQIPLELRERVLRYIHTALGNKGRLIRREEVELFKMLSKPLREEVQLNLHYATFKSHTLFKLLFHASPPLMRRITADAVTEVVLSNGDTLFSVGEDVDKMAFVDSGVLRYAAVVPSTFQARGGTGGDGHAIVHATSAVSVDQSVVATLISSGEHFCEACLWTKWHCRGTMRSDANSHLVELSGSAFRSTVKRNGFVSNIILEYAKAFIQALQDRESDGNLPLTDVHSDLLGDGKQLAHVLNEAKHWVDTASKRSHKPGPSPSTGTG